MAESELRQRRGAAEEKEAADEEAEEEKEAKGDEEVEELDPGSIKMDAALLELAREKAQAAGLDPSPEVLEKLVVHDLSKLIERAKRKPTPGLSNATKKAKDALAKDPYSLQLISELGIAYCEDEKWTEGANVLIRGWKRMKEIELPEARFEFLMRLTEASYHCQRFQQALAVLLDIEEPEDTIDLREYCILACQVYCQNDNLTAALQSFHKAIKDASFEDAIGVWMMTSFGLHKVGAYEAARQAIDKTVENDEQRQKLEALDKLSEMREQLVKTANRPSAWMHVVVIVIVVVAMVFYLLWTLYKMEKRSLDRMKLQK